MRKSRFTESQIVVVIKDSFNQGTAITVASAMEIRRTGF